jgi:glycine oxidase
MSDCIVIGGGLIGMLTARRLHAAGKSVILLEKGRLGQESSWAGGGIISPLYPWRYPGPINALAAYSQQNYESLCNVLHVETGLDPEWTPSGMLMLEPGDVAEAQAWAESCHADMQRLAPDSVAAIEPALSSEAGEALWMPQIAQLRNPRMVHALRRSLELRGVEVREQTEVSELSVDQDRITGVVTAQGRLKADQVILCGGAWSGQLLSAFNGALPVEPVRGQMLLFRGAPGTIRRIVLSQGKYVIPRRDGRVLVGSTVEHVGFDKTTTESVREELSEVAGTILPCFRDMELEHHWSGLRPGSADELPFIGDYPDIDGLYVNAGHYRNGVVMGLASAELLANLVLDEPPVVDPAPYSPERINLMPA